MLRCWLASRMPVNCQSFALVLSRSPESDVRCGVNSEYRIEVVGRTSQNANPGLVVEGAPISI